MQRGGVFAVEADLDRRRRAGQVADQIAENSEKLDAKSGLAGLDLLAQLAHHFFALAVLAAELHREVAGVRLRDAGQSELQAGAPRKALYIGRLLQQTLHVAQQAIGFQKRRPRRRDVIEDERALIERWEKLAAQKFVDQISDKEQPADEE